MGMWCELWQPLRFWGYYCSKTESILKGTSSYNYLFYASKRYVHESEELIHVDLSESFMSCRPWSNPLSGLVFLVRNLVHPDTLPPPWSLPSPLMDTLTHTLTHVHMSAHTHSHIHTHTHTCVRPAQQGPSNLVPSSLYWLKVTSQSDRKDLTSKECPERVASSILRLCG